MGNAASLVARLLLRSESRALRAAEAVLVDTEANAEHVSGLFNVPRERIRALPLALEVFSCKIPPPVPRHGHATKVLFIGTFVPLQGTTLIAQAIVALREHEDLEFLIIDLGKASGRARVCQKM